MYHWRPSRYSRNVQGGVGRNSVFSLKTKYFLLILLLHCERNIFLLTTTTTHASALWALSCQGPAVLVSTFLRLWLSMGLDIYLEQKQGVLGEWEHYRSGVREVGGVRETQLFPEVCWKSLKRQNTFEKLRLCHPLENYWVLQDSN